MEVSPTWLRYTKSVQAVWRQNIRGTQFIIVDSVRFKSEEEIQSSNLIYESEGTITTGQKILSVKLALDERDHGGMCLEKRKNGQKLIELKYYTDGKQDVSRKFLYNSQAEELERTDFSCLHAGANV